MARTSGPGTREKLIRAAEELFAAQGVDGAQLRDIIRLAGQSNPSAVQYHFGSRAGLLDSVMAGRQRRTEAVLADLIGEGGQDLRGLLTALVAAEATELGTERGQRCLQVSAQLSHESGVRARIPHPTIEDTVYWQLIERLDLCLGVLPEPVRLERVDLALTLIGAAMADRARQYLAGAEPLTAEQFFLADLVSMTAALLTAPVPHEAPDGADAQAERRNES